MIYNEKCYVDWLVEDNLR